MIKGNKGTQKTFHNSSSYKNTDFKKRILQENLLNNKLQKTLLKRKEDKPTGKSKLKLKGPIDKKGF